MIYNSISTLPLKIYDSISRTGNIKLLADGNYSEQEILMAWDNINKEFFTEFGYEGTKKTELANKLRYLKHMATYYLKGDKFAKTLAKIEEQKIEIKQGGSFLKICVSVSKALEMRIDYNTVSVGEFFHYLKLAEEISKKYKNE